jgi:hypothetical protein
MAAVTSGESKIEADFEVVVKVPIIKESSTGMTRDAEEGVLR